MKAQGYRVVETVEHLNNKGFWDTDYLNVIRLTNEEFVRRYPGIRFTLPKLDGEPLVHYDNEVSGPQGLFRSAIRAFPVREVIMAKDPMALALESLGL